MDITQQIRPITLAEAVINYNSLKCINGTLTMQRAGLKALDYFFFYYRLQTRSKHHDTTFFEIYKNDYEKLVQIAERIKRGTDLPSLFAGYELYYGTVNQFRPSIAKYIYQRYEPSTVLDFSAGWGGRCLGAMSMGVPYIGIDSNVELKTPYREMIQRYDPMALVKMFFQPAETFDFSSVKYDMIFTSPPYFMLEKYQGMPEYESRDDFINSFFVPVVMSAWYYLSIGGHMVLNMPSAMYECLTGLGEAEVIEMPIKKRPGCLKTVGEKIYVWKKTVTFVDDGLGK
jgi:hypothetical protein